MSASGLARRGTAGPAALAGRRRPAASRAAGLPLAALDVLSDAGDPTESFGRSPRPTNPGWGRFVDPPFRADPAGLNELVRSGLIASR